MKNKENIVFYLIVVLFIVPLWVFPEIPVQDGPSHLAGANILKEYNIEVGAKILSEVVIGNNVIIGANSVVVNSIPVDTTAAGIPAKPLRQAGPTNS